MFKRKVEMYLQILLILCCSSATFSLSNSQYVEYYANYRHYLEDDKVNYKYHYYVDHSPSRVHMMHREERHGDYVVGQYGLLEPNGLVRSVHYQVNGNGGFESIVQTRTPFSRTHFRLSHQKQPDEPVILEKLIASVV